MLENKKIGVAMAASHCNLSRAMGALEQLVAAGAQVIPIFSYSVANVKTRFGDGAQWLAQAEEITGVRPLCTVPEVEPFGPTIQPDCTVVMPCTGNTLAKLANAITDGPVLMAAKATLRNQKPVVLAITTNDGLGLNAKNLGVLLAAKNIYFVPFAQDNPVGKPTSLDANVETFLVPTVEAALAGQQLQPLLLGPSL